MTRAGRGMNELAAAPVMGAAGQCSSPRAGLRGSDLETGCESPTLVLGSVPDDFTPETHLPLGPWCFVGRERVYEDWERLPFEPDPFASAEDLAEASQLTSDYASSLMPWLTERLNQLNGTSYSITFWRFLVMPWLLLLVQSAWERQCRLKGFLARHGTGAIAVDILTKPTAWMFEDTLEFLYQGVLNPTYNEWLYSRMIGGLRPESWRIREIERTIPPPPLQAAASLKARVRDAVDAWMRCSGVYGIGRLQALFWSALLELKPRNEGAVAAPGEGRQATASLEWIIDMRELIGRTLPRCFKTVRERAHAARAERSGRIRLIGPQLYYGEEAKLRLALAIEGGERLIVTQHGGNYGTLQAMSNSAEVEYRHRAFFSWGWSEHGDYAGRIHALPSPYLSKWAGSHRERREEMIFVGTFANLLAYRLDSVPQALQNLRHRRRKLEFFRRLSPAVAAHTWYRPYFLESGALEDGAFFREQCPELRFLEGNLPRRLIGSRLLLVDHPITTLNFAMAANIPLVGLWEKEAWAFCRQAQPYFEALERVGVIFEDAAESADHVNRIWDDVEGWWNQPEIQIARKAWCDRYARTDRWGWWWQWARALWRA